jgi:hypothetical protein
VRQYTPDCTLLVPGPQREECLAARAGDRLTGVAWWAWVLLGVVLALILLVLARAFCSWRGGAREAGRHRKPSRQGRPVRPSCMKAGDEGCLEEDCYVPPPPPGPPAAPRMSWQETPLLKPQQLLQPAASEQHSLPYAQLQQGSRSSVYV